MFLNKINYYFSASADDQKPWLEPPPPPLPENKLINHLSIFVYPFVYQQVIKTGLRRHRCDRQIVFLTIQTYSYTFLFISSLSEAVSATAAASAAENSS